ncbi:MAG TPA: ubiquinone/menaquinone biosynthesis methyltransferase [Chthoniobacterales bacterium]|nr:ubiquinone/menaquinone biosynthesis methyltransferase [Chthoniobacterales bacterium]
MHDGVNLAEPERVRAMFGSIARRYDLANHLLSCGVDFYWRRRAAQIVASWAPRNILDVATGTGDLAIALGKAAPTAEITAVDVLPEMIAIAQRKGVTSARVADAMNLPFGEASFDCATIAFGLRNLPDWAGGVREMVRVLRAGGHVLILEFSIPTMPILRGPYRFYLHRCLPIAGALLTGHRGAYDYLGESIEQFPSGSRMIELLETNGFRNATAEPLTGGIVSMYTAKKL